MTDEKKEFAFKHREDVIDTLRLRAGERRLLGFLLVILLLTVVYENGTVIFEHFCSGNFEIAALGERKKTVVKPESLKKLIKSLDLVAVDYPQFHARLSREKTIVNEAFQLAAAEETADKAVVTTGSALAGLYEFVSHPVVVRNKNLEALDKEIKQLAKALKISLCHEFELRPLNFKTNIPIAEADGQRNLFEFK